MREHHPSLGTANAQKSDKTSCRVCQHTCKCQKPSKHVKEHMIMMAITKSVKHSKIAKLPTLSQGYAVSHGHGHVHNLPSLWSWQK